jgi:CheY-like chemotaxis protein
MAILEQDKQRTASWAGAGAPPVTNKSALGVPPVHAANALIPNILVVDDDPVVREQLARVYKLCGYTVVAVSSAEEALARLEEGVIDFVITDIKLPGLSGSELIANMQENFPDVPVIAITGYSTY